MLREEQVSSIQLTSLSQMPSEAADFQPAPYLHGHTKTWNDAWQRLYESWQDVILAFCLRQGLNDHSARNVCQETMMTVLRSQYGETAAHDGRKGPFQSWVWGVVRNRVKAERRRHSREILTAPVPDQRDSAKASVRTVSYEPTVDPCGAEAEERQALLIAALQRLQQRVNPENFQIYVALMEESGTPESLAREHGKTVNNVYAIKHRCEELLAREARAIRHEQEIP